MMCLADDFKQLRKRNGMSQQEFGAIFGYRKSTISDIERKKKEVPEFMVSKAVQEFNDLSLALEKCQECKNNQFIPAKVDVDSSPAEVLDILIEEFEEAKQAAKKAKRDLKLYNRKSRKSLNKTEFLKLVDCTEQIYDPMTGIVKWLEVFQENYGGNAKEIRSRNTTKLYDNGAKRNNSPAGTDELK
mgnify:CR=1 FL=1